jgi:dTDP-4-amino-4,6-dideoxygalactose transaminase
VKTLTTGEGGAVMTNDAELYRQMVLLRTHGITKDPALLTQNPGPWYYEMHALGFHYRMTDMQAAVGIEQMKRLGWIVARRRELAARYTAALAGHAWLEPPFVPDYAETNFQSYAVRLRPGAPVSRNDLMQRLLDQGIASRRGVMLSHLEPPYADAPDAVRLPVSEEASDRSLLLPLYPQMTEAEQDQVIRALYQAFPEPAAAPAQTNGLRFALAGRERET